MSEPEERAPLPEERRITHRYEDPLDRIWLSAARRIGLKVVRSPDAFAHADGRGGLHIGSPESLDPDDCLAQMIFHELCHSLVEGPESLEVPDWGLDNEGLRDLERERACLRLQASLAEEHGLRAVLAPTTDHRAYYDQLPADPLAGESAAAIAAKRGWARVERAPWRPHLREALAATEAVARAAAAFADRGRDEEPSLFALTQDPPPRHPLGHPLRPTGEERCAGCVWAQPDPTRGEGEGEARGCAQAGGAAVDPDWPACLRFEPALDCLRCGACCREAFQSVEVDPEEPALALHPELFRRREGRLSLQRVGPGDERCVALRGDLLSGIPYTCVIYEDRPRTCRDFTRGSLHCLTARRRVGLSR